MIPFAASLEWYAAWWKARRDGLTDSEAVSAANVATGIGGKDYARCKISANGNDILLSMAIEGGASILKRQSKISSARLSDHGNWRHVHLGAFEAAYGRSPYYQHLIPYIKEIYNSNEQTILGFNQAIHKTICTFLNIESIKTNQIAVTSVNPEILKERGSEIASKISQDLSIIDSIMQYGAETVLALEIL